MTQIPTSIEQVDAAWMSEALEAMAQSPEQRAQVRRGALLSLQARYRVWTGIERHIVAWRQPASMEAAQKGLHGARLEAVDTRSPGALPELMAAVDAFLDGAPWPLPPNEAMEGSLR